MNESCPGLIARKQPRATPASLRLALNPFPKGAEPKFAPLRPTVVNLAQFPDVNEQEILEYDLIVLCDVNQLGAAELRRAKDNLAKGIKDPRDRAREADRIEDLSREAERLEQEIARATR